MPATICALGHLSPGVSHCPTCKGPTKLICAFGPDPLCLCMRPPGHDGEHGAARAGEPRFHAAFRSPGPPWYAARCRLLEGHEGNCDTGTIEEARAAWNQTWAKHPEAK